MKKIISLMLCLVLSFCLFNMAVLANDENEVWEYSSHDTFCYKNIDGVVYFCRTDVKNPKATVVNFLGKYQSVFYIKNEINISTVKNPVPVYTLSSNAENTAMYFNNLIDNNNVKEIYLSDSIKNAENTGNYKNLKKVYIGKNFSSFNDAFFNCPKISFEISKDNEKFILNGNKILSKNKKTQYYEINAPKDYIVDKQLKNIYFNANKNTVEKLRIKHKMSIVKGYYRSLGQLRELVFEKNANASNSIEFKHCKKLRKVVLPLNRDNSGRFTDCKSLKSVTLPKTVKKISSYALADCKNLNKITLPKSVKIIGSGAFENCKKLNNITIPKSVKSIGDFAFENCTKLEKVTISNTKSAPKIKKSFSSTKSGIKFYAKNKKVAKQLKKNLKGSGVKKTKIYVGKKLIYKNVK